MHGQISSETPIHWYNLFSTVRGYLLITLPEDRTLLNNIESLTRLMCYKLHLKRLFLYNNIKGVPGNDSAADPT